MSNYTTELRWIVEQMADPTATTVSQKITSATPKIFNFYFPIFDETHRQTLEEKIIRHYFTHEIAFETVGLWQFYLEERMNLIMPYYNDLYKTTQEEYNILDTVNWTETMSRSVDREETAAETTTGKTDVESSLSSNSETNLTQDHANHGNAIVSDFPQSKIGTTDYATQSSETNDTQSSDDTSTVEETSSSNSTTDVTTSRNNTVNGSTGEEYTKNVKGLMGGKTYTELVQEYRAAILNIDKLIIDELYDMFMLIY